ncbi:MAG: rhodanese-like domain-containing protein [Campylobacter sp.]|nr:rhodanese-like domain-containing protein [Campylobacter sp.]
MKQILKFALCAAICASAASAKITTIEPTLESIEKYDQIVDIRTPGEWQETGVIKDAKLVTLVNDKDVFLANLKDAGIDTSKPFALICRSGRRSMAAARLIDNEKMDITNLDGGMSGLMSKGYKTAPYDVQ